MKSVTRNLFLAGLSALVLGAPAWAAPPTINPADAKAALRKANDAVLADFRRQFPELKFEDPCAREYNEAIKAAEAEHTACLDISNPPAGSPYADFNANAAKTLTDCGNAGLSLDACMDKLAKAQAKFCAINAAKAKARAKTAQQKCCSGFAARKKELEAELKAINDRLAICLGN
jgi:hypothetical protein